MSPTQGIGGEGIGPDGPGIVPFHIPDIVNRWVWNAAANPAATAFSFMAPNEANICAANGADAPPNVIWLLIVAIVPGGIPDGLRFLPVQYLTIPSAAGI